MIFHQSAIQKKHRPRVADGCRPSLRLPDGLFQGESSSRATQCHRRYIEKLVYQDSAVTISLYFIQYWSIGDWKVFLMKKQMTLHHRWFWKHCLEYLVMNELHILQESSVIFFLSWVFIRPWGSGSSIICPKIARIVGLFWYPWNEPYAETCVTRHVNFTHGWELSCEKATTPHTGVQRSPCTWAGILPASNLGLFHGLTVILAWKTFPSGAPEHPPSH